VRTSRTEEKVIANDIFRERVTLRGVEGELRTIPLPELRAEMLAAGDPLAGALEAAARDLPVPIASREELDELPSFETGYTDEFPVQLAPPARAARATQPVRAPRPAAPVRPPRPSAPVAPARPSGEETEESVDPALDETGEHPATAEGERRSQRRRGRRGGRRNRPSGGGSAPPADGTTTGGDAPGGE
jgi:hypothetical protein